jgi:hypothetical protein
MRALRRKNQYTRCADNMLLASSRESFSLSPEWPSVPTTRWYEGACGRPVPGIAERHYRTLQVII